MHNKFIKEDLTLPVNSFENYPMTWRPRITKSGEIPLYIEIARALEQSIRNGSLHPYDKLPPQRELADFLDVNLSTIARAFKLCTTKGLISGEIGSGTYIASDVLSNLPMLDETGMDQCINLGASHPLYSQNKYIADILKKLIQKSNPGRLFEYAETAGRKTHRQSAQHWLAKQGLIIDAEQILITAGLQNSLAIILTSLFHYGNKIATNAVIYPGIKNIANDLGIQLLPVPYRQNRMDMESLVQLCKTEAITGLYIIPDHQNPTALWMEEKERQQAAAICQQYHLICIEDGTYSFLGNKSRTPITKLIPEQSMYISTVSNALSAGLRIAFVTMPAPWRDRLIKGNSNINVMASPLEAEIVHQAIDCGLASKIVQEKIHELRRRNALTDAYLSAYTVLGNCRSQFRWLKLPDTWTGHRFEQAAKVQGVQVFCCERFLVGRAAVSPAVRLAISSPRTLEDLKQGLQIIQSLL